MISLFKRKKRPYPHSFAKRLTWRIMLTVLIVMGFISFWFFFAGWALMKTMAHYAASEYLEGKCETIRRALTEVRVASVNTVPRIEENIDKPGRMFDIVEQLVRQNSNIRSCGISFAADYYPQKGHWFCPYATRRDSDNVVVQTIGDRQHDYLQEEWFSKALAAEEGFWSEPFFDGQDKKTPLVSWLSPIRDKQGKVVAVLGVDLSLDGMADKIQDFTPKRHEAHGDSSGIKITVSQDDNDEWNSEFELYTFVIDSSGTYLIHPDQKRVVNGNYFTYAAATPDSSDDRFGKELISGKNGFYEGFDGNDLVLDGQEVFVEYMPVEDTHWSIVMVISKIILNILAYVVGGIFSFFVLIGLLVLFFTGRHSIKRATKSLKQLAASADEVAKGNFNTVLPTLKSRDELHLLRDSFEKMQHSLTAYIDELKTTTAQKASIESELKVAHDIQMSMLPKTFPPFPERNDIDIYGSLKPAKDVGGDLFDFFIRDEQLYFCIGDVSGKGVPASLVMAVTRSLFRNISAHVAIPDQIVSTLNNAMAEGNETNMFVTLFVGVLDLATGHLAYSNAGHDAPLLIEKGVSIMPCDSNLPIGVMPKMDYTTQEMVLSPDATIFLFTDGLNEAEDIVHAQFGDQRIFDVATSLSANGQHQPLNVVNAMTEAVHAFVGEAEQSDDLTMLAIQYKSTHADERQ